MRKLILIFVSVYSLGSAFAADLKAPMELESAQVLPEGVRNPRFKNLFMSIDTRFNNLGQREPLGNKLNKEVTWGNLLTKQNSDADRQRLIGLLQASGIDPAVGGPGTTSGQVNTFVDVKVPVLAVGLTNRLTIAVAAPVMKVDVSADTGFLGNESGDRFLKNLCDSDPVKCNEVKNKLTDATNQKLTEFGYEPIQSHQVKGLGDIKFVSKYLFFEDDKNKFSLKGELTLPTGIPPNPDKALDIPTGDGQWDVGVGLIWDAQITERIKLNHFAGYTVQLPDRIERRIPTAVDTLSKEKEFLVRNLGDLWSSGISLSYGFPAVGLTFGGGYHLQYLSQTTYQDGAHASYRYRLLEMEFPDQIAHSTILVATFSTVEWYQSNQFAVPFQANLAYSKPFAGRNITQNDVLTAEMVLFF